MSDTPETCPHTDFGVCIYCERDALNFRLAELERINKTSCEEWADDHTHLQKLCREAGCTEYEVEGDSYGVPCISDLADFLAGKLASERAHADRLAEAFSKYVEWHGPSWSNGEENYCEEAVALDKAVNDAFAAHEALRKP